MLSGIEAKVVLNRVEPLTRVLSTMRIILGNETLSVNETGVVIYTKRVDTDPGTHVYHVPVYISDNVSMCGFVESPAWNTSLKYGCLNATKEPGARRARFNREHHSTKGHRLVERGPGKR